MALPTIEDAYTGLVQRYSFIAHNTGKFALFPTNWEEIVGYREREDPQLGFETTRMYVGPWSERLIFRQWVMGVSYRTNDGTSVPQGISRTLPAQDPTYPQLYAVSCELIEASGAVVQDPNNFAINSSNSALDPAQVLPCAAFVDNRYAGGCVASNVSDDQQVKFGDGKALMRVTYRSVPFEVRSNIEISFLAGGELGRFVERVYSPTVEALPLARLASTTLDPSKALQFITADPVPAIYQGKIVPEPGVIMLPSAQITWIWHAVPSPPFAAMFGLLGKINSVGFDGSYAGLTGYRACDPETLLFQQPSWRRRGRDSGGDVLYDLQIRCLHRPQGWNQLPAPDGNVYPVTWGGDPDGESIYSTTDFNAIFEPQVPIRWQ